MALNAASLSAEMKAAVDTAVAAALAGGDSIDSIRTDIFDALASAIVTHITTNAVVTVASVSGVTTGPGSSGPGAGTIS